MGRPIDESPVQPVPYTTEERARMRQALTLCLQALSPLLAWNGLPATMAEVRQWQALARAAEKKAREAL